MAEMVTVACKLPNGIILELGEHPNTKRVAIKGSNSNKVITARSEFAYTEVDKAFMDAWMAKHDTFAFVKNGLLVVQKDRRNAEAVAKENASNPTGLDPVDPNKPPKGIASAEA